MTRIPADDKNGFRRARVVIGLVTALTDLYPAGRWRCVWSLHWSPVSVSAAPARSSCVSAASALATQRASAIPR